MSSSSPVAPRLQEISAGSIAVGLIARAVRRQRMLLGGVTLFAATIALLMFTGPTTYRATTVIRLGPERRGFAVAMRDPMAKPNRSLALLESLVPRLRSRTVIGSVVDSLGLRLRALAPVPAWPAWRTVSLDLRDVSVGSEVRGDTLKLGFGDSEVFVRRATASAHAPYGTPVQFGAIRFTVPAKPAVAHALAIVVPRELAVDQLLGQLAVVPLVNTDALEVRFLDVDPSRAQRVANQIVKTFNTANVTGTQQQARQRREFLGEQLGKTEEQLARAQGSLAAFRSRHVFGNADGLAMHQSAIMALDARRDDLQVDLRVLESLAARLQVRDDSAAAELQRELSYAPEIAADPVLAQLYQQVLLYRTRLDSLTAGPWASSADNPDVVQLRQLLATAQAELGTAVRTGLGSLQTRMGALSELGRTSAGNLRALPAFQAEEERLSQQVSALSDFQSLLRIHFERAQLFERLAVGDIEIVDLASQPYLPAGIPWWLKAAVALVLGLGFAIAAATFVDLRNRSIRGPDDVAQVLRVPGFGIVPQVVEGMAPLGLIGSGRVSGGNRTRVDLASAQPVAASESFRVLYSSLVRGWGNRTRTLMVTSVGRQEGKTFVAGNLAATFAREGARVLLVDCDVRHARLHRMFQVPRAPGLLELLNPAPTPEVGTTSGEDRHPRLRSYSFLLGAEYAGEPGRPTARAPILTIAVPDRTPHGSTHVRGTAVDGLWLLPAGSWAAGTAEGLRVDAVRAALRNLTEQIDVVILDTPPALVSADAAILAPLADDVIIVVRAGSTDRESLERAREQLTAAGARGVGALVNDPEGMTARSREHYYGCDSFPDLG
ncbi:MAG: exopolysaccharide transport family protein [Gemmatimonadales bacterium]